MMLMMMIMMMVMMIHICGHADDHDDGDDTMVVTMKKMPMMLDHDHDGDAHDADGLYWMTYDGGR